jgi:AraC-like DNA-binding protein
MALACGLDGTEPLLDTGSQSASCYPASSTTGSTRRMPFHQRRPAPPLDLFIESVWLCKNLHAHNTLQRIIPSPGTQLVLNLKEDETRVYEPETLRCHRTSGSVLTGISTRYQIIDTAEQEHVAGIVFRPGGTLPFFPLPAGELAGIDIPLDALWGRRRTNALRDQLLSAATPAASLDSLEAVLRQAFRSTAAHPATTFALTEFHSQPAVTRIASVAHTIGLSQKRFIERFRNEVGLTPKRYCRLLRFQSILTHAHQSTRTAWADLALSCGYSDQAHMIHEFREFSGLTPSAYESLRTEYQNHVNFLQSPVMPEIA